MKIVQRARTWAGNAGIVSAISGLSLIFGLFGCSTTEAPTSVAGSSPDRLFVQVPLSGNLRDNLNQLARKPGELRTDGGSDIIVTQRISASAGGSVTAGRHTVTFFPGSLRKDTDITVVDKTPSTGTIEAQLFPEGITFRGTVILSTFTMDIHNPGDLTYYWWNPSTSTWVDIGGQVTIDGVGVFTNLSHFSIYRPGKAGW